MSSDEFKDEIIRMLMLDLKPGDLLIRKHTNGRVHFSRYSHILNGVGEPVYPTQAKLCLIIQGVELFHFAVSMAELRSLYFIPSD
jgi:hypothetical protein